MEQVQVGAPREPLGSGPPPSVCTSPSSPPGPCPFSVTALLSQLHLSGEAQGAQLFLIDSWP